MEKKKYRRLIWGLVILSICFSLFYGYYYLRLSVPDELKILLGESEEFNFSVPIRASVSEDAAGVLYVNEKPLSKEDITIDLNTPFSVSANELGTYEVSLRLFGILPVKEVSLQVIEELELIPGGNVIGLQVETDGILVLGTGAVLTKDGSYREPAAGILKSGDYILEVDGTPVSTKEKLISMIGEKELVLTVERDGKRQRVRLAPVQDNTGSYKIGTWIRTDTQGIGTLTFMTSSGSFGALGHGITDIDTGVLMKVGSGAIYEAEVLNIIRGKDGTPGELVGIIRRSGDSLIGTITRNTGQGIFGETNRARAARQGTSAGKWNEPIPIGLKQEIKAGKASILCQVDSQVKEYEIEILKIDLGASGGSKGLVIQITDEELLKKTGGIVQGMSGSPILQNGKLIGAVTHVFIRDSTKGYGTFIETMLKTIK